MTATLDRQQYASTSARGLRWDSVPMRLFAKARKLGTWNPSDFDFTQDKRDWAELSETDRDFMLRLLSQFQAGEEAVTLDLLPLVMAVARDGQVEEELYLTSFLWEEAKHVVLFRRWLDEVVELKDDLHHYLGENYRTIFFEELPRSMGRLTTDTSREALAEASVTYNMIVEGVLAETGYHGFRLGLKKNGIMPGLSAAIEMTARDESRHIRYGVYLLQRLVAEDDATWAVINRRMNELFPAAMGLIAEFWEPYDADDGPFGLDMGTFVEYSSIQFDKRMKVLERDRGKTLAEVERAVLGDIAAEEAEAGAEAVPA